MRTRLLLLALAPVALLGCEESASEPDSGPAELYGEWDALRTCGGIFPMCFEGDGRLIFERPDSLLVLDASGAVTLSGRFRVREGEDTPYSLRDDVDVWLDEEWHFWMQIVKLTADSLWLSDNSADGYTTELVRLD